MNIFFCVYWPSVSSLEKCLFRSFAHFLTGLFLVIELYELFIYFDALDGCIICKYFLLVCRLAFHSVYVFLYYCPGRLTSENIGMIYVREFFLPMFFSGVLLYHVLYLGL